MCELWENCHHTIFQSHLNQLIQALRLRKNRAWAIVRQELLKELDPDRNAQAKPLYDFLMQVMVPYKCFLRMKMQGLYRDVRVLTACRWDNLLTIPQYIHPDIPNVILRGRDLTAQD